MLGLAAPGYRPGVALVAPFPWFGGKRKIAAMVWERLGEVKHYIEPFFGGGAVLLGAPSPAKIETINDLDGFVANFWRAVARAPHEVAQHADWPVSELDLHAWHTRLIARRPTLTEQLVADPDYFDAEVAGRWVWGAGQWIGSGWGHRPTRQLPFLAHSGMGLHSFAHRDAGPYGTIGRLAARMRHVRVCCGDWTRLLTKSALVTNPRAGGGTAAVFLDPPYSHALHDGETYGAADVAPAVAVWAREHGEDPALRIALCGYEGEHEMPGWTAVRWDTTKGQRGGGWGQTARSKNNRARENARRETVWFSPSCLRPNA